MTKWLVGYKIEEKTLGDMIVDVDQCSPRDHYLYLYNEEEQEVVVEKDIANVPEALARILGVITPGAWSYAIKLEVIDSITEIPENGNSAFYAASDEEEN